MAMYTSPKRPLNDSLMGPRLRSKATLSGLNRLLDSCLRGNDGSNGAVGPRENDHPSSRALERLTCATETAIQRSVVRPESPSGFPPARE